MSGVARVLACMKERKTSPTFTWENYKTLLHFPAPTLLHVCASQKLDSTLI